MDQRVIERIIGAEAVVDICDDFVLKRRVVKKYRTTEIDAKLRKERTRLEAKIQSEARRAGVRTPIIQAVEGFEITMERIKGSAVRFAINETIAEQVGEMLCALHQAGIVHGDPTTRNMIFSSGKVFLIDFGLACYDTSVEARGVDVHVFFQALEASHENFISIKSAFILGYAKKCRDAQQILDKVHEIKRRGRYL
jgi:TP53 regulating kinase and related kinases